MDYAGNGPVINRFEFNAVRRVLVFRLSLRRAQTTNDMRFFCDDVNGLMRRRTQSEDKYSTKFMFSVNGGRLCRFSHVRNRNKRKKSVLTVFKGPLKVGRCDRFRLFLFILLRV